MRLILFNVQTQNQALFYRKGLGVAFMGVQDAVAALPFLPTVPISIGVFM